VVIEMLLQDIQKVIDRLRTQQEMLMHAFHALQKSMECASVPVSDLVARMG
jgi:hypothetical protein